MKVEAGKLPVLVFQTTSWEYIKGLTALNKLD